MKQISFIIILFTLSFSINSHFLMGLDVRDIMHKVENRETGDNSISQMQMLLIDKYGKQRLRTLKTFTKQKADDELTLTFFLSPSRVKNTAFLTFDYKALNKDDDQWMYLPAAKNLTRIASGDKSGAFMGSDFTYSDMTKKNTQNYNYKLLKETTIKDHPVFMIEAKPANTKTTKETGYNRSILWVRKDNYVSVRALHFLSKDNKKKYFEIKELKKIDNIWVSIKMQMKTKRDKETLHTTVIQQDYIRFNQNLLESDFTLSKLKKGI